MSRCKNGNIKVRIKDEVQLTKLHKAIAELRAFCLKHSAAYMYGIGPKLTAKLRIKIKIQNREI